MDGGNRIRRLTAVVVTVIVLAVGGGVALRVLWPGGGTVVVVHWSNGHLMRQGLLPEMAAEFNRASHRTKSGKRIEVQVVGYGSWEQAEDLLS
jgi:hypothetical protein